MRYNTNNVTIELESDNEVQAFWNIVEFARDLDAKEHCFTDAERSLANRLENISRHKHEDEFEFKYEESSLTRNDDNADSLKEKSGYFDKYFDCTVITRYIIKNDKDEQFLIEECTLENYASKMFNDLTKSLKDFNKIVKHAVPELYKDDETIYKEFDVVTLNKNHVELSRVTYRYNEPDGFCPVNVSAPILTREELCTPEVYEKVVNPFSGPDSFIEAYENEKKK